MDCCKAKEFSLGYEAKRQEDFVEQAAYICGGSCDAMAADFHALVNALCDEYVKAQQQMT